MFVTSCVLGRGGMLQWEGERQRERRAAQRCSPAPLYMIILAVYDIAFAFCVHTPPPPFLFSLPL